MAESKIGRVLEESSKGDKGEYFSDPVTGRTGYAAPNQVQGYANVGGRVVSKNEAQKQGTAQANVDWANNEVSDMEAAAAGVGSGITLGLGPAALAGLGLVDPGKLSALETNGAFTAGDFAGMIAPALLTGGEGALARGAVAGAERAEGGVIARALARTPAGMMNAAGNGMERLLGAALPEMGVMGKLARPTLQMAGRGATEGAIINLAQTTSENIVHDQPFTVQAMAASGLDGALMGGLLGGAFGAVTSLGSLGLDGVQGAIAGAGGRIGGENAVIRRMGGEASDFAKLQARPGDVSGAVKGYGKILEDNGASFASKDSVIAEVSKKTVKESDQVIRSVAETLQSEAASKVPQVERVLARVQQDIEALAPIEQGRAMGMVENLQKNMEPLGGAPAMRQRGEFAGIAPEKPGPMPPRNKGGFENPEYQEWFQKNSSYNEELTRFNEAKAAHESLPALIQEGASKGSWKGWIESRDALAGMAQRSSGIQKNVYESALNAFDSEISTAMIDAAESIGKSGLAEQFQSAVMQKRLAGEMADMIEARITGRAARGSSLALSGGDVGALAYGSLMGHPIGAAGIVAGKKIVAHVQDALTPQMAEAAYRMSIGSKAAAAAAQTQQKMTSTIRRYISGAAKGAVREGSKPTKKTTVDYDKSMEATEKLLSYQHRANVDKYAQQLALAGHPDMAKETIGMYDRAAAYVNKVSTPSTKQRQEMKLGKTPKPFGMDSKMMRAKQVTDVLKQPLSLLDKLEDGTVTLTQVRAIKYVMPEFHKELVSTAMNEIVQYRASGKTLKADQIANLSTLLDMPLDSKLEKEFVGIVQAAHNQNNKPADGQTNMTAPPPQGPAPILDPNSLQTATQSIG